MVPEHSGDRLPLESTRDHLPVALRTRNQLGDAAISSVEAAAKYWIESVGDTPEEEVAHRILLELSSSFKKYLSFKQYEDLW
jgi:hypothetical protein